MFPPERRPLTLAVSHEDGHLSLCLSDGRSVAQFGRIAADFGTLQDLVAWAAQIREFAPLSTTRDEAARDVQALGEALFAKLIPTSIAKVLARMSGRFLTIQLPESLIDIPWEVVFDGTNFLNDQLLVARQLISNQAPARLPAARAPRESMRLLIVQGDAENRAVQVAVEQIPDIEHITVQHVHAAKLAPGEVLQLIGDSDVVQYFGTTNHLAHNKNDVSWWKARSSVTFRQIAELAHPPRLLVSIDTRDGGQANLSHAEHHALVQACAHHGLSVLTCNASLTDGSRMQFMPELYRALARGASLGESAQYAIATTRAKQGTSSGLYLSMLLYGDCTAVVFPAGRGLQREDHRRQLTMISHDLVDSTMLLGSLGAEKYSALLAAYHERCWRIVDRYGGRSDDPQGDDGIMCYFGLPALEGATVRALRAALEIVDAVAELGVQVRIGVVTGPVVIADGTPVGVSIHLAARLRSIAEPGTIMVADSTRLIVKDSFVFRAIDHIPNLKGIDRPVAVYRVVAEARQETVDTHETTPPPAPFVGRGTELYRLREQWLDVCRGELKTVLVCGEAGIGKSRLVREFRRTISLPVRQTVECRCTPDHAHSAFHPIIDFLWRLLRLDDCHTVGRKLARIEAAVKGIPVDDTAQYVATLLSIPFESRYVPSMHAPERKRQLTLDVLIEWTRREATRLPQCLIFEDVQWLDASTREFLDRLIVAASHLPILIILTERVDPNHARVPGFGALEIELNGLSRDASRELIVAACGNAAIPPDIIRLLTDKADGVPLFIEESTRMALDERQHAGSGGGLSWLNFTVPSTIEDLLMERLDRLASAKPIAQVGAAIGREFSLSLLEAVLAQKNLPIRIDNLKARLAVLIRSGLLIEKGTSQNISYYFKHALVRDAAYHSLWERDRERLHRAIAVIVRGQFPELADSQPELLAYHYTQAGIDADAVMYWELAARRAASRSAHVEAISHLTHGLDRANRLALTQDRDRKELTLQLLLAGQLIATEGYGAERVGRTYARASELCENVGKESDFVKAQFGLEAYHFMRADFDQAHAIARKTAELSSRSDQGLRKVQSEWAVANILFHRGELQCAVKRMDACLATYRRLDHRPAIVQDPGVMCLCYSAWGKWELGFPDEALRRTEEVVDLAESLKHPFSIGEAYGFRTAVHYFRGEYEQARDWAKRAVKICEDGGFAVWLAHAKLMHGRIVAELGDSDTGIDEMRLAYDMWAATGAVVTTPFYLALQAEGLARAARVGEGLDRLREAYEIIRSHGERYYEAEVMRLLGELTLLAAKQQSRDASDEAETWFQAARKSAGSRELHSLSLRAAMGLARLRIEQGRAREAIQILEPARDNICNGSTTRDVREANALLGSIYPLVSVD